MSHQAESKKRLTFQNCCVSLWKNSYKTHIFTQVHSCFCTALAIRALAALTATAPETATHTSTAHEATAFEATTTTKVLTVQAQSSINQTEATVATATSSIVIVPTATIPAATYLHYQHPTHLQQQYSWNNSIPSNNAFGYSTQSHSTLR